MTKEILNNINLLKKYDIITFDYTEYPHKSFWSYEMKDKSYREALKDWLSNPGAGSTMFYAHIPFCPKLCYYCLCSKEVTGNYARVKDYLRKYLFSEIDILRDFLETHNLHPDFEEIYLGGGSPTYLRETEFESLVKKMRTVIDFNKIKHFIIEVDPRQIDLDRLRFYHKCGVNKMSFGIQDFDPDVLKEINREQPPELIEKLLTAEIRSYFHSINFDILVGLPKQTPATMRRTIERVIKMRPDRVAFTYVHYKPTVRAYMLQMNRNKLLPDFYDRKAIFVEGVAALLAAGYIRTGFEHFAKPSDPLAKSMKKANALYNSLGTTTGDATNFIAVGSSGHGVLGEDYYFQNYYELNLYKAALDQRKFPIYRGYKLTHEDKLRRDIIKIIRTYFVIDIPMIEEKYAVDFFKFFARELKTLKQFNQDGLVEISKAKLELTRIGRYFAPIVASVFDAYVHTPRYNADIYVPRINNESHG